MIAILSGVSFSLHNEFFFSQSQETTRLGLGAAVLIPYWIGELPIVTVYAIMSCRSHSQKHHSLWSKSESKYFRNNKVFWFNVFGLLLRTLLVHLSMIAFYSVLVYVDQAQISLAVISSMFSIAAFFTAFVFYVVFRERLELKHYVGMSMLTLAIAIITQSQPKKGEKEAQCSIWVPIAFVVLNAMVHTGITTQGRYWQLKSSIDSFFL